MRKETGPVSIKFNPEEFEKVKLAKKYTAISSTSALIRSCVNVGLKNVLTNGKVELVFFTEKKVDKEIAYKTQVLFDDESNTVLEKIFGCIPMTPSYIVKYFLMPELDKIIENKGWKM